MSSKKRRKRYLLTLYRQDIINPAAMTQDWKRDGNIFVMDYFDRLEVMEVPAEKGLACFLGMKDSRRFQTDVTAMQTYSIYRDFAGIETEDIFNGYSQYPYIGLIHVYITPDVIAGLKKDTDDYRYLERFEEELSVLLKSYINDRMTGRVFRIMSTSDFIVVIRSTVPEAAFHFSTEIRKIMVGKENAPKECFAAFKTYTILGVKQMEYHEDALSVGGIAIRGRYSNRYWKDQASLNLPSLDNGDIKALYGRYDFCIHLTLQEFSDIYKMLTKAKGLSKGEVFLSAGSSGKVQYLFHLLEKNYLSYINERYYMDISAQDAVESVSKITGKTDSVSCKIWLSEDCSTETFMKDELNQSCRKMLERIRRLDTKLEGIKMRRKSLASVIQLLPQLVFLCLNANDLSEIRIYVKALLKQMNVVLTAAEHWINVYKRTKDSEFLDFFESHFREAVVAMDAYGRMIRNDNFQTLQSPRYNIVPGCSMEKVLIGYSAFVEVMMRFCMENEGLGMGSEREYLPVVVPNLSRSSMMAKVLFPEWICDLAGDYTAINKKRIYFMVIEGPATGELVDVPYIVATLFHEIAHHLRYESREQRNGVLLQMLLYEIADVVAESIFNEMTDEDIGIDAAAQINKLLVDQIYNTMKEMFFREEQISYNNLSLESFKFFLQNDMNQFILSMQCMERDQKLLNGIKQFLRDSDECIAADQVDCLNAIRSLWEAAEGLAACENPADLYQFKLALKEALDRYVNCCTSSDVGLSAPDGLDLKNLAEVVIDYIENYYPEQGSRFTGKSESFYQVLYQNMNEQYEHLFNCDNSYRLTMKEALRHARLFGIDYDFKDNKTRFDNMIKKGFRKMDQYLFDSYMKAIALYREETSDLFMCVMLDLSIAGYLTVCARMDANDGGEYAWGYIDRFTDIIIILWLSEDESWTDDTVGAIIRNAVRQFREIAARLSGEQDFLQIEQLTLLRNRLYSLMGNSKLRLEEKNIITMSFQILTELENRINWFQTQQYLYEDFQRGKRKYQILREDFKYSRNIGVDIISKFCTHSRQYLNSFCILSSDEEQEEYESSVEAFLMEMASCEKIEIARKKDYVDSMY